MAGVFALATAVDAPVLMAAGRNTVRDVHLEQQDGKTRVVFNLSGSAKHKMFHLAHPSRIVLDFPDTVVAAGKHLAVRPSPLVKGVRYAMRNRHDLRVVLDLTQEAESQTFVRRSSKRRELVLEFESAGIVENAAAAAIVSEPVVRKPIKTSRHQPPKKLRDLIIAIDAGHGGKDPGATGKKGTREKQVVLQMARRLAKHLEREPGYKPVLIRSSDVFLPLRDRIKKARAAKADLFISIHADASPNSRAQGSSVYILSQHGASSEAARFLAKQENAVDLIGGISLENRDEMLASVLLDLSQRHTIETSYEAASKMLAELNRVGKVHSRKVEKASFVVLKSPDIPSVLVETAFISNPREERRLKTREHQEKLVRSMLKGIKKYFSDNAPEDALVARIKNQEHVIRRGETLSGIASLYRVKVDHLRSVNGLSGDKLLVGKKLKIPVTET